jgi:WD40 repeat protein/serine/threonine protein kinase
MSAVYRATDPNLRRMVAIKLIHPHLSVDPNFVDRFKEEAAAVARLRHPNIVQVHDFNIDGETYYMVMEYLIGETLQARLKRLNSEHRYMPYPEVIRFCTQLCGAVGYAHNHELIHRDIKPANIMLDVNGQAILMDFGIVKIIGGEYHTATGATIGTAMYMSPEQIRSERSDERSDIYSLGVTLYEMISGRAPYKADSAMTLMMMVLNDPLPDLRRIRRGIPEGLVAVVEKAMAKDQNDRFQTMEEMAAALNNAQTQVASAASVATLVDEGQSAEALPPDSPPKVQPETQLDTIQPDSSAALPLEEPESVVRDPEIQGQAERISAEPSMGDLPVEPVSAPQEKAPIQKQQAFSSPYRRFIIIGAVLLLLAAATVVGYIYISSQGVPDIQLTSISQPPAPVNDQTAQYVVNLGRWETNSFIEQLAYAPDGETLGTAHNRDWERFSKYRFYGALWGVASGSLQNYLLRHDQWVNSVAFSPDGALLATASDDEKVLLWGVSDGSLEREIEAFLGAIAAVDFSPNNLLLAAGSSGGDAGLWQLSDDHLLRTLRGHLDSLNDVEFSPDGQLLASASDDQTIMLWQVSDGSPLHTLRGHNGAIHEVAFSPDGSLLASASHDFTIGIWQVADGSQVSFLPGHSEAVLDVAFSPDGSLLASGSADGTLRLWRATNGELLHILTDNSEGITSIAFSPGGHLLVSAHSDGVIRFWGLSEALPLEEQTPLTETEPPASTPTLAAPLQETTPTPASLAASGPWALFSNDEGMWVANLDGNALTNLIPEPVEGVYDLNNAVSPDGRYLAFLTAMDNFHDLTLHVITLPEGENVLQLPLTSSQTEPDDDAIQGDPTLEIASAISLPENPIWSPDGLFVAFMGAHKGPTSDLYTYSLESGEVTQLTDGISQGIKPTWSPDGGYIVHSGVSTLGTGAGYDLDAVWAAPADGSDVLTLYRPESGDEIWLGWADAETLLVYSWSAVCEAYNLRAVNIAANEIHPLWENNFHTAALDPDSGTLALAVREAFPMCGDEVAIGLYLIFPYGQETIQVATDQDIAIDRTSELIWSDQQEQFLMGTENGLVAVNLSGELNRLPAPGANSPVLSPDGSMLAWRFTSLQDSVGVWVAEWGADPRQIYDQNAGWALWTANDSLLFIGSDGLYLAREPDFEPDLVQPDFWASGIALAGK